MVVPLEDTRDNVGLHPARVLGPGVPELLAISLVDLQTPGERHEKICSKCNLNDIGDEFHYLLVCPFLFISNLVVFDPRRSFLAWRSLLVE